ncbi:ECF RNA polymerase sigma factor SigK [Kocuria arenosa]|uniref:ECF RNA polymerase sigma factor SigK n=1 Tax=Kocuria arenosa TaxID=3071446 RepID=UPI0034D4DDE2
MTEPRPRPGDHQDLPTGPPDRTVPHHQHAPSSGQTASGGHNRADLADLLRRSGTGDEAAFAALYDATSAKVYGVALRVARSPEIAAEVLQEVYLMAWQQAFRFDPARGTVLGWLCTLAHRRAVDRIRQVAREKDREQTFANRRAGTSVDVTWQEVEQALDTQQVQAAMDALTQLQREAVSLAYYEGGTYQQVAQRLDIPLGTAKARIRDGLHRLRTALGVRP